ncbi:MAG: FkbM family methyltransferase [Limisphaerales bacterium]
MGHAPTHRPSEKAAPKRVGPLLGALGFLSRKTPYFRGKWRVTGFIFERWLLRSRKQQVIRLPRGMRINCKLWDEVQNAIWWNGPNYERKESRFIRRYLKPGMVFFDVGSNVGYYTLLAAPIVGKHGRVHAFEPVSEQHDDLRANVERNQLQNVVPERLIITDRAGTMEINLGSEDNAGTASVDLVYRESRPTESVSCTTLDEYLRERGVAQVDVLKIDVEGHEPFVLRGMAGTLRTLRPLLLVEVRGDMLEEVGSSREALFEQIAAHGYVPYALTRGGWPKPMVIPADGNLIIFSPDEKLHEKHRPFAKLRRKKKTE